MKEDIKEYQNMTDRKIDALENKTNVYNAAAKWRLDDLENKTRVYGAVVSNMTDRSYHTGNLIPIFICYLTFR